MQPLLLNPDFIAQAVLVAIVTAIITAFFTAIVTAFVSSKVVEAQLKDLTARTARIEHYLNGLLTATDRKRGRELGPKS